MRSGPKAFVPMAPHALFSAISRERAMLPASFFCCSSYSVDGVHIVDFALTAVVVVIVIFEGLAHTAPSTRVSRSTRLNQDKEGCKPKCHDWAFEFPQLAPALGVPIFVQTIIAEKVFVSIANPPTSYWSLSGPPGPKSKNSL